MSMPAARFARQPSRFMQQRTLLEVKSVTDTSNLVSIKGLASDYVPRCLEDCKDCTGVYRDVIRKQLMPCRCICHETKQRLHEVNEPVKPILHDLPRVELTDSTKKTAPWTNNGVE